MRNGHAFRTFCAISIIAIMLLSPLPAKALVGELGSIEVAAGEHPGSASVSNGPPASRSVRGPLGNSDVVDATGYNGQRKLLRGPAGTINAVFSRNGQIHYTNSTDGGVTWFGTQVISGATTLAKHPSMAIAGTHFYIVWEDGANISFRRTPDMGASWVPPLANPPMILKTDVVNHPAVPVVAATNLDVVVAWSGFDGGTTSYEIQFVHSVNNGSTFSAIAPLTNSGLMAGAPSISANGTGYYLVYHIGNPGTRQIFFRSSITSGASWNAALNISQNPGDNIDPNIVSDGVKLYVVWVEIWNGNPDIIFKKSQDGGQNWDVSATQISVNPSNSYGPMISVVPNGDIYVVWYDNQRAPHYDIFLRRYNASSLSWEAKFQASDLDEGYNLPSTNPYSTSGRVEWIYTYGRQATFTIFYNYHLTKAYNAPQLVWTGEPNYQTGGVYPQSGHTTADTYTFRIKYVSASNIAPSNTVRVLVDYNRDGHFNITDIKENCAMAPDDPFATDYKSGVMFGFGMKFPGLGTYKYRFYASDTANDLASGVGVDTYNYPTINIVDHEPRLFWTNEKGYSSDGVEPNSGVSSTNYTWRVSYFSQENNPPLLGYPKVWIDLNLDVYQDPEEWFNLTEVDPADKAYDDGKFYTYSTTLPDMGVYNYTFNTRDSWGIMNLLTDKPAVMTAGPIVTAKTTPPVLKFTTETGFTNGLAPLSGSTSTLFTFKIIYFSNENSSPGQGYPKVWIDKDIDNTFQDNEKFIMVPENAANKNYHDGAVYKYEIQLPIVGTYSYRFEARDKYDTQATGTTVGQQQGPVVTKVNHAPAIAYPQTEGYVTDGVNPDTGRNTTKFTFRVQYTDVDNDTPLASYPKVWIDKDMDHAKDANELFAMSPVATSTKEYTKGVVYTYSLILNKVGKYTYSFDAWDGFDGHATGPATVVMLGPDVDPKYNNPPRLDWAGGTGYTDVGVLPASGPSTQTFTYKVKYTDYDNDSPNDGFPKLWLDLNGNGGYNDSNEHQSMWPEDKNKTNYADGVVYEYVTDLSTSFTNMGTYSYMVLAQDAKGTDAVAGRPLIRSIGPTITSGNNAPRLAWPGDRDYENVSVHPVSGNTSTLFVYRVKYIDEDNDPPLFSYPKIFIDTDNQALARKMQKEDQSANDYTKGVVYTYNATLTLGNHRFRFLAFDQYNTMASAADPPMQTSDGPLVEFNSPPVLNWMTDGSFKNGVGSQSLTAGKKTTFKVLYSDPEGDIPAPGYPRLLIDLNGDGDFQDPLEIIELVQVSGDYKSGMTYSIELTLGTGKHVYRFEAKDIKGNVASGNDPIKLQSKGVVVKEQASNTGLTMIIYVLFIVIIVVVGVVGFLVGKRMGRGGAKPSKKTEEAHAPAAQYQEPEGQAQQGYAYDPNQAAYQYPPEAYQAPQVPAQEPAPEPQAPAPEPRPPEKPVAPPALPAPPKPQAPPKG
jgi:hypothetical protein